MNTVFYKVEISAEDREQALAILQPLLEQKLVTGGQLIVAPTRFLWKGDIEDMDTYVTITSFTVETNKARIIEEVKKVSVEEVPMIVFLPMEGNTEFTDWITKTLS